MHQGGEHLSKSQISGHDLRLESITTWTWAYNEHHAATEAAADIEACQLQTPVGKKCTSTRCALQALTRSKLEFWVQFSAQPAKKDWHQMEDIWNEDKFWETKCERDMTCPHIKGCYKKEENKLFFTFIVDTAQNKGLILQKRFKEEI